MCGCPPVTRAKTVVVLENSMSRPPSVSQLLKRAGLSKRPRPVPPAKQERSAHHGLTASSTSAEGNCNKGKKRAAAPAAGSSTISDGLVRCIGEEDKDLVDDKIAALERELRSSSDGISGDGEDSGSGSESSSGTDEDRDDASAAGRGSKHNGGSTHKLVSPLDAEKIQPLPRHLLPLPGCGVSKKSKTSGDVPPTKASKKRRRDGADKNADGGGPGVSAGLEGAVKELLANYEARSSERVPFYCRVCKFQGDSLEALERHKEEPLHLEATKKERKVSKCNLCKKQFTSPPQLQEHLSGKAHMEKLQSVMARQGKRGPNSYAGESSSDRSDGRGWSDSRQRHAFGGPRSGGWRGGRGARGGRGRGPERG